MGLVRGGCQSKNIFFIKLDGFLFDFVYLQMDVGMLYSKGGNERHAKLIVNGSLDSVSRLTLALSPPLYTTHSASLPHPTFIII